MPVESHDHGTASERDRLSVLLAVTLTGITLLDFVELPTFSWSVRRILGSPLGLTITGDWVLSLLMMGLIASGAFSLLKSHPHLSSDDRPLLFSLITPTLGALFFSLILIRAASWPLWLGSFLLSGVMLGILVHLSYRGVSSQSPGYAGARTALNIADYLLAFALFSLVMGSRERALVTGPVVLLLGGFFALDLLSSGAPQLKSVILFSGLIALLEGELAWVIGYWPISPWTAAVVLTLGLYLGTGISYQHLLGKLDRRVLLEFSLLAGVVFVLVLLIKP
ncbi:MAG: hypothetical protein JXB35_04285 [Anaerolineae bacterium]|nr:hypothetical protein [Anaerolineae bacterium]